MQFKAGKPIFITGTPAFVREQLLEVCSSFQKQHTKVLFIDTTPSMNQEQYLEHQKMNVFQSVYTIQAARLYDLYMRLETVDQFIKENDVGALVISCLSNQLDPGSSEESTLLIRYILNTCERISKKCNIPSIIGNATIDHHAFVAVPS